MANPVEWVNLVLRVPILRGFASIRLAVSFQISHQVRGAGKLRAARCVDEKMEAANRELQFIVMTNRSLGVVLEVAELRP